MYYIPKYERIGKRPPCVRWHRYRKLIYSSKLRAKRSFRKLSNSGAVTSARFLLIWVYLYNWITVYSCMISCSKLSKARTPCAFKADQIQRHLGLYSTHQQMKQFEELLIQFGQNGSAQNHLICIGRRRIAGAQYWEHRMLIAAAYWPENGRCKFYGKILHI